MQMVIGLTGLAGSGKGEACSYLKSRGFAVLSFSDILREESGKRGILAGSLEEQKATLSKLGEQLRKESGDWGILARMLAKKVDSNAVVDGFRSAEEVAVFRERFPNFRLVLIEVDFNLRFERRKLQDSAATKEAMLRRDNDNISFMGLGKVMQMADVRIDNNGTKEELYSKQEKIIGS